MRGAPRQTKEEAEQEFQHYADLERKARKRCFERCRRGDFLDLENGCVSVCKSAKECTGWRAML